MPWWDVLILKIGLLALARFFEYLAMETDKVNKDNVLSMTFYKEGSRYDR